MLKDLGRVTGTRGMSSEPATAEGQVTTVRQGEQSLSHVAGRLGVPADSLRQANPQVKDPNQLKVGQDLFVPGKESSGKPASASFTAPAQAPGADSGAQKSALRMEGQLARARLNAQTVSSGQNEAVPERKSAAAMTKKGSSGGFEVSGSVDLGAMHASAEFGSKDLQNGWNSVVDAVEHPSDVLEHAEGDISNAAEVEGNQILYGKVPQLPLPPNPVFNAIHEAQFNPTLVHVSMQFGNIVVEGPIDGAMKLDEGLKHAGREIKGGIQHAGKEIGKAIAGAENAAGNAWNTVSNAASDAADAASDAASDAADAAGDAADAAGDAVSDLF